MLKTIIDSVKEQFERDSKYIKDLGLTLKYALETLIHADHINASSLFRQTFDVHRDSGNECPDIKVIDGTEFYLGEQVIRACVRINFQQGDSATLYEPITQIFFKQLIRKSHQTGNHC